ncbi:hypothetical protein BDV18DRAFT_38669 [Aspergillus unguis]
MSSQEGNTNYGAPYINACWALTALVTLALMFRYTAKAWVSWALPNVSSPPRIWGAEDLLFMFGYAFDMAHMALVQKSLEAGLGRHVWFLSDEQRIRALRFDYISQPLAVLASMLSRCGMTWFLYTCFSSLDRHVRVLIIAGMVIQIVINSVTILQIVLQCGPNPYTVVNRAAYFHYMWDGVPADNSVVCQSPDIQTTIGFVQGGLNSVVDFVLTVLSAMQLWQFSLRSINRAPTAASPGSNSFFAQLKRMPRQARTRRLWQTVILSGPLALSGCASIVKTYTLKSLGERNDFTHNIIPFVFWVKIENYSILLATCGPVIRLFARVVFGDKDGSKAASHSASKYGGLSNSASRGDQYGDQIQGSVIMSVFADRRNEQCENDSEIKEGRSYIGGVNVKTDITVQVDEDGASTSSLIRSRQI